MDDTSEQSVDTGDLAEVPDHERSAVDAPDDRSENALEGGDDTEGLRDMDPGRVAFLAEED